MLAVTLTVIKLFFFILGCGKLWVADGQWKLIFAHCMMKRKVGIHLLSIYKSKFSLVIQCTFF